MFTATPTSCQVASMNVPPRQTAGAKPMAWSAPSMRSHRSASAAWMTGSWAGSLTSNSSTSASTGSLRAVRRVSDSPRPAPVRMTSAPSCWASLATPKAMEASVRTPVITMRLPSSRPMDPPTRCGAVTLPAGAHELDLTRHQALHVDRSAPPRVTGCKSECWEQRVRREAALPLAWRQSGSRSSSARVRSTARWRSATRC